MVNSVNTCHCFPRQNVLFARKLCLSEERKFLANIPLFSLSPSSIRLAFREKKVNGKSLILNWIFNEGKNAFVGLGVKEKRKSSQEKVFLFRGC